MNAHSSHSSLGTLLEHAQAACDAAAQAHQQAKQQLDQEESRWDGLISYLNEQDQRWNEHCAKGAQIHVLQAHQQFGQRLQAAITMQQKTVVLARAKVEQCHLECVEREIRAASIRKLLERREATEAQKDLRREQKTQDEWASQIARQQSAGMSITGSADHPTRSKAVS